MLCCTKVRRRILCVLSTVVDLGGQHREGPGKRRARLPLALLTVRRRAGDTPRAMTFILAAVGVMSDGSGGRVIPAGELGSKRDRHDGPQLEGVGQPEVPPAVLSAHIHGVVTFAARARRPAAPDEAAEAGHAHYRHQGHAGQRRVRRAVLVDGRALCRIVQGGGRGADRRGRHRPRRVPVVPVRRDRRRRRGPA